MDTTDSMLPAWSDARPDSSPPDGNSGDPPLPPGAPSRRHRVLVVLGTILGTVFVASAVIAGIVRLPYDSIGPGSTRAVNDLVAVQGHETFPPEGKILYATVSVRERVNVLQALVGWLDPDTDVIPEEKVRGDIPPDQYRQLNVEAMSDSKTSAEVLALAHIGYTNLGVGAEVEGISPDSPAAAVLQTKDVIVALDENRVSTTGDVVTAIRAHQPGDVIKIRVLRGPDQQPLETEATLARAEDGRPLLGVRLSTKVELPFDITIDSGSVVGPSAGLAYALELLDVLTAGELTGGVKIAATGEVSPGGQVGAVGGVAQKVVTVKRAGAKVFLVPKANEAEAKARAGKSLQVYGVETFDEALNVLGALQGSNARALATPSPGA